MPKIESYRKQAKLLMRWHREHNYSVGAKVRLLERYRELTDKQVLDMPMPLALAQEIVAIEAGFSGWADLKKRSDDEAAAPKDAPAAERVLAVVPILFVRDVERAAAFYRDKLGFDVDFLHGKPTFYGSVSRNGVCLHLRYVAEPNFSELAARECSLIVASFEVTGVKALFNEIAERGADIAQPLAIQAWGGLDFHVRDPDGNVISFVEYRVPTNQAKSAEAAKD